uniref:NADH-ubiquinone oxidoreductase chain 4 n=2 Tax=Diximermis spiculatus TaxID=3313489 RepID=Q1HBB2_9BILA|nr:NADH dehydrogenase subunit 4 [Strelkovimermis spiculatus]ABF48168.1 NADH dehydrogenase subunit 4 [Strelkovimermis spiculatus]ABF48180.1 NADH dehydrogenase subunit 4 [Strelkovimermis spiculatus]
MIIMFLLIKTLKVYVMFKSWLNLFLLIMMVIWLLLNFLSLMTWSKNLLVNSMMIIIWLFFISNSVSLLYIIYESIMLLMILLIVGWGLNPYKFNAFMYLMAYSMLFSLPAMMVVLVNYQMLLTYNLMAKNLNVSVLSFIMLMMMFLVKMPVFFLHYWLPKAHVEASTTGSIILASGLLKLGSVGVFKIMNWGNFIKLSNYSFFVVGTFVMSLCCLFQTDFKKLIALTSVVHMNMSLTSIFYSSVSGLKSFTMINVIHSISSFMLFYLAGMLMVFSKTRLVYLQMMLKFSLLFYLFMCAIFMNLSVPPFFSFMGELIYYSLVSVSNYIYLCLNLMILVISLMFSLLLVNNMSMKKIVKPMLSSLMCLVLPSVMGVMLWLN